MKKIVVIGGGAAGMMAAVSCAEKLRKDAVVEGRVLLLERNDKLGAKVLLSGGGRCNLTTGIIDVKKVLANYPRGARFLMGAMYKFSPQKVQEWFELHGVKLKTEADLRVFPVSNNGVTVVSVFERLMNELDIAVNLRSVVMAIQKAESLSPDGRQQFEIVLKSGEVVVADRVILACGGNAFSFTGSRGDGYAFARGLGHSIKPLAPSLSSFVAREDVRDLAGISFQKAEIVVEGKELYKRTGAFVFTHRGISGPAVFALSSMAAYEVIDEMNTLKLKINFFPELSRDELRAKLQKLTETDGKKSVVNLLDMFLPKRLGEKIIRKCRLDMMMKAAALTHDQRAAILDELHAFELTICDRGTGDEFVTAGGVNTDEVNSNTMESKLCPGLFFAGEILDVDGFTGGFNLQASWATGKVAGESAAEI